MDRLRDPSTGIEIKDRTFRLKKYSNCFTGMYAPLEVVFVLVDITILPVRMFLSCCVVTTSFSRDSFLLSSFSFCRLFCFFLFECVCVFALPPLPCCLSCFPFMSASMCLHVLIIVETGEDLVIWLLNYDDFNCPNKEAAIARFHLIAGTSN